MTQSKLGASLNRGRPFNSVASSALGLSALIGAVVLSGGQAKAFWLPQNPIAPSTGPASTSATFTNPNDLNLLKQAPSPWLGDKRITYLDSNLPTTGTYNWEFAFNPSFPRPWQTDLDFPAAGVQTSGYFVYKIEIDPINSTDMARCTGTVCAPYFGDVELFGTTGTNNLSKEIGTGYSGGNLTGKIGSTLTTANPIASNVGGTTLYVKQSWAPAGGAVLDQIGDRYSQQVPGPLPILSAPLVFGFYRKLRSNTKLLRKPA